MTEHSCPSQRFRPGDFTSREPAAPPREPVDPDLFARTAPAWNCVTADDGPHYLSSGPVPPRGTCLWCGAGPEEIKHTRKEAS